MQTLDVVEPEKRYPFAPMGIFLTVQGEGALLGHPTVFLRLAGCSVGCPECDTDYRVTKRLTVDEIASAVSRVKIGRVQWAWITGGEPTDHDLWPIISAVRSCGLKVAVATAGVREVKLGSAWGGADFLSVSPHSREFVQRRGDQINLVPGLNGLTWEDVDAIADDCGGNFSHRYLTPMADREGRVQHLERCIQWVQCHEGWRLGVQAHKMWRLP